MMVVLIAGLWRWHDDGCGGRVMVVMAG